MAKDLTISLEDKPGSLAHMAETLGDAGINIMGGCGLTIRGNSEIHIAVEDAAKARAALEAKGITVDKERDVLLVYMRAVPGELNRQAGILSAAGVNIDLFYWTEDGRLVIGADDLAKAKAALYPHQA
jgi:hypothetical protein